MKMIVFEIVWIFNVPQSPMHRISHQVGTIGRWKNRQEVKPSGRSCGHCDHAPEEGSGTLPLLLSLLISGHGREVLLTTCSFPDMLPHPSPIAMGQTNHGQEPPKQWAKLNIVLVKFNYIRYFIRGELTNTFCVFISLEQRTENFFITQQS